MMLVYVILGLHAFSVLLALFSGRISCPEERFSGPGLVGALLLVGVGWYTGNQVWFYVAAGISMLTHLHQGLLTMWALKEKSRSPQ